MNNIEVLVIEDDVRVADVHCRFLEKIEGFTVIARASTGEEALDWLESFSPHLILLDVFLPDILGVDLIDKIQEVSPTSSIILITAATEAHIVQKAYRKNVTDYILKPFTFEQLKESIEKFRYKYLLLKNNEKFTQEKIQYLWPKAGSSTPIETPLLLPKGIDPTTMNHVINHLSIMENGSTAELLGKNIGVSRSTARRYLEFLVTQKQVYTELTYGTVGRPERRYFIST
ncbi:response regulator [Lysinibacillus sp. HST-98]|uniref:response regulator n=1 Tax=Lysinibacillus TaxID=400634 RepID=UPI0001DA51E9|nr:MULTISPECIES: response regulator [Lysinibacillus]EFI70525.1 transcriptional regulatory protein [Lysinibacillus fusiformis ZC1]EKU41627.1 transcriptional regulatory protein [Lysinibacillus fusiformis ZB2]MBL3731145.1 response regulator [Lysinibacillus sp. HST-98]MBU5251750.1 response regulator [Lysinibacillus capsici]MED4697887.1 response regulator [Lysinibacillus capsici]